MIDKPKLLRVIGFRGVVDKSGTPKVFTSDIDDIKPQNILVLLLFLGWTNLQKTGFKPRQWEVETVGQMDP